MASIVNINALSRLSLPVRPSKSLLFLYLFLFLSLSLPMPMPRSRSYPIDIMTRTTQKTTWRVSTVCSRAVGNPELNPTSPR
ncbi:hypothetical protein QBC45DRAFT_415960 [Copromyces sp. CBS 386.78]|nr:hypothetical protein QBC45DRAFT_415960 [Copromyces sp. CBS 386.78]